MGSTSTQNFWTGDAALLAVGACLSVISLGVVVERAEPSHAPRAAPPGFHRMDAALPLADLEPITMPTPPVPDVRPENHLRQVDADSPEITRSSIPLDPPPCNDLSMQARIVPAFVNGEPVGLKLFLIRPDSLYSQIGLLDGDVIRRINGMDISSPEKALEAYTLLKAARRIEIDLERDGWPMHKSYVVR
jgi:hypothetical protein